MSITDIVMIVAVVLGPIFGAAVAIFLEDRRERRGRKLEVFRTLLRTRRGRLWPDHVNALNLVEVEFYGDNKVQSAFKHYLEHLSTTFPRPPEDEIKPTDDETEVKRKEDRYWSRIWPERDRRFTNMLHAIAHHLGFQRMQQLDIMAGGYVPKGWSDIDDENTSIRKLFSQIGDGKRLFPIAVLHYQQVDVPPPSTVDEGDARLTAR